MGVMVFLSGLMGVDGGGGVAIGVDFLLVRRRTRSLEGGERGCSVKDWSRNNQRRKKEEESAKAKNNFRTLTRTRIKIFDSATHLNGRPR